MCALKPGGFLFLAVPVGTSLHHRQPVELSQKRLSLVHAVCRVLEDMFVRLSVCPSVRPSDFVLSSTDLLFVFIGPDELAWNAHRVYGKIRIMWLFRGW